MDYNWVDGPGGFKSHSPYMENITVSNNTNFNGRKVKSLKVTTKELFDTDGKMVSKETVEEFEYEPEPKVLPRPSHDPYQILREQWTQPVVWSVVGGSYERDNPAPDYWDDFDHQ